MPALRTLLLSFACIPFLAGGLAAAQSPFYLSTDRIFNSTEDTVVRVEGREIDRLSLRIYRIDNPRAFFEGQENPYQVKATGTRVPGLRQLAGMFLSGVRNDVAETLKQKISHKALPVALRKEVKELLSVREFSGSVEKRGYLRQFRLMRDLAVRLDAVEGGWSYNLVKLPLFEKGVYLIEGVAGKDVAYTVAVVSDLAVISRHAADKAIFYVTDRKTGRPQAARLTLFRKGQSALALSTDGNGLAAHDRRDWLSGRSWMLAEGPSGISLHDATYYPSSSFGVQSTKCYIYTERPLYKPGQKLFFRAILRDYDAGYRQGQLASGTAVPVEIVAPSGKTIATLSGTGGAFATLGGEWQIPDTAEPGTYRLVVATGNRRYEAPFRIENYVKPPFEVTIRTEKPVFSFGDTVKGRISARYFFGEAVRDADLQYFVYRTERVRSWDLGIPYGWYLQDNELKNTREEKVYEGRGRTDSEGLCEFSFSANTQNLKGEAYTYRIEARISDRTRRLVRGSQTFDVVQGQFWLKLGLAREYFKPGETGTFTVAARGYDGKPANPDYHARVIYYKWDTAYMSRPAERVIKFEKRFELPSEDSFRYSFAEAGHYQIELTATDSAGNKITTSQFVWVAGNADKFIVQETGLRVVADKKIYALGDTAEMLLLSPVPDVRVLYTIEGDTILDSGVLTLSGNSIIKKIPIRERMMPNAWLVLHYVFNDRIYTARQQLIVPPKEKFLAISLSGLKDRYRPGETVTGRVTVKDSAGRGVPVALSVGVVDRAVLALQPKLMPDIERFFYHPHRNNVIGASSFYTRFYGYAEEDKLELARHLRGDSALADLTKGGMQRQFENSVRSVFRDVAWWSGEIRTDRSGTGAISFKLPDNITEWSMECVAADGSDRVGSSLSRFITRKDFFIRPVVPQYLYENDTVILAASVHNLMASAQRGIVRLKVKGGELLSAEAQTVTVPAGGEALVSWKVRTPSIGTLETEFSATGPEGDTEIQKIAVQAFARDLFEHWSGPLAGAGRVLTEKFSLPLLARLADAKATVRVSPSLINLVEDALKYLVGYPYGCVEQTLSRFVPNLLVMKMQGALPFRDEYLKTVMPELTTTAINRLQTMQNNDGSWGWFASDRADLFMTSYAVYSLALARDLGYTDEVSEMLRKGATFLARQLRTRQDQPPAVRAFTLFALSQYQKNQYRTMILTALENTPASEHLAMAFLANAAAGSDLAGRVPALVAAQLAGRKLTSGEHNISYYEDDEPADNTSWQRDSNITDALLLRALVVTGQDRATCQQLVNGLLDRRQESGWNSTLDTAFVLSAFVDFSRRWQAPSTALTAKVRLNGRELVFARAGAGAEGTFPVGALLPGNNQLQFEGDNQLYYSAGVRYHSRQARFEASKGPLALSRTYFSIERGSDGKQRIASELKGELPKGKLVLVRLKVRTDRNIDYVMLEDPLPAGCEYVAERDPGFVEGVRLNNWLAHQVMRDRLVFFQRYLQAPEMEVWYLMRPFLDGEYQVLPASVGSMYYPDFTATSASDTLRVVKP